ncbi:MAG: tetratricopeptide repeat protein [Pseudomonadota bacterium]
MKYLVFLPLLAAVAFAPACSSGKGKTTVAVQAGESPIPSIPLPPEVSAENLEESLRRFRDMDSGSSAYDEFRRKLAAVLFKKHEKVAGEGNNAEAYKCFSTILRCYSPEEILTGEVTAEVEKMAEWTVATYSPLGDEAKVMIGMLVLMNKHGDDDDLQKKFDTLTKWIDEARDSLDDDMERIYQVIEVYEEVSRGVPVPVVTTRLVELYRSRHKDFTDLLDTYAVKGMQLGNVYMKYYYMNTMIEKTSYDLVRLYTRMGRPAGALADIEKYRGKRGYDPKLVEILEDIAGSPGETEAYLKLSGVFMPDDDEEALWSCYKGWKKDPEDWRFPMCLAGLYQKRNDLEGAEEYLNVARGLNDKNSEIYVRLITLYKRWLDEVVEKEDNTAALMLLGKLEKAYQAFESRWPDTKAPIEWGEIVKQRGLVEFYTGNIDDSVKHLQQAGYQSKDAESLLTLGTIYIFKGEADKALSVLSDALDIHHPSQMETHYFKLLIFKKMGDASRIGGKQKEALRYYTDALKIAKGLIPYISLDFVGKLHSIEGELEYRLGNKKEAVASFKMAASLSENDSTYAGILSFIAGARDMDLMRELYHLAYTDSAISKKWKIYFSLWYIALAKYLDAEEDPTPQQVLAMAKGDEWIEKLAGYYNNRLTYDEVKKSATTKGETIELDFYHAFNMLKDGKKKEFAGLMKAMLETGYFAYYEVAMSLEILFDLGEL